MPSPAAIESPMTTTESGEGASTVEGSSEPPPQAVASSAMTASAGTDLNAGMRLFSTVNGVSMSRIVATFCGGSIRTASSACDWPKATLWGLALLAVTGASSAMAEPGYVDAHY